MKYTKQQYISFLILVLSFLSLQSIQAQKMENTQAQNIGNTQKNSIYATFGTIIFSSQVSVSYERLLIKKKISETRAKLNYGNYLSNNFDYATGAKVWDSYFSVSAVQLISIVEINLGLAFSKFRLAEGFDPEPNVDYTTVMNGTSFYGNFGLRYSKNKFLVRAGFGFPELLYFGLGFNF